MDNGFQFLDIILLAAVAGGIFLRLRSVLGRRMGHEQSSPEEKARQRAEGHKAKLDEAPTEDNVVLLGDKNKKIASSPFAGTALMRTALSIKALIRQHLSRGPRPPMKKSSSPSPKAIGKR